MTEIQQIVHRLKNEGQRFGIVLNPPVSEIELVEFQKELQIDLPPDVVEFYKECNGFESDDALFRILPLKEIIEYKSELKVGTFYFAEHLIYSDTFDIELNEGDSKTYKITNRGPSTKEPTNICDSLYSFLDKYLSGTGLFGEQGLYNWIDEMRSSK